MSTTVNDNNKIKVPVMRDLTEHMRYANEHGYVANFRVTDKGLTSQDSGKSYSPEDLLIVNFYRYEGISDPEDNSILYVIETRDGAKGLLVDAYGAYSDPKVEEFMKQVRIDDKG